jgi:hypothetical protein
VKLLGVIAVLLLLVVGSAGQSCSIWNTGAPGTNDLVDYSDSAYHITGVHYMDTFRSGSCVYNNTYGNQVGSPCETTLSVYDEPTAGDDGYVKGADHIHSTNARAGSTNGFGSVNGSAEGAAGVALCPFYSCNISVSLGGVVTVSPAGSTPIWSRTDYYNTACQGHVMGCPIIIDTMHEGFQLTDAEEGVVTDMVIPGRRMRFGWTRRGSHNAFLWLDGHLFGNSTAQPPSEDPNGFAALAVYDSNHDGVIDDKDPVFLQLRGWIDTNHNGRVDPGELHPLKELGVFSISLKHELDKHRDEFGNLFHYRGSLKSAASDVDRTIYDVYFTTAE